MTPTEGILLVLSLVSAGSSLFFHYETKRKQREEQARWTRRQQSLESEIGKLRGAVGELRVRVGDGEHQASLSKLCHTPQDSLNLNRRTQALRLFRRGEQPEKVAKLLAMPVQESVLLHKVFRSINEAGETGGAFYPKSGS